MRIAIDGIFMQSSQPGGYRTYTTNLVRALAHLGSADDFFLAVGPPVSLMLPPNWHVASLPRKGTLGFVSREQISLPKYLKAEGIDILHAPGATGPLYSSVPLVVTIYDTIEFSEPLPYPKEARRWSMRVYSRWVQKAAARKARLILTISDYSKGKIGRFFGIPSERIIATPLAPSEGYRPLHKGAARQESATRYGTDRHIMAFASAAPRKNVVKLIEAYCQLGADLRKRHTLVLVCTHESARSEMARATAAARIEQNVLLVDHASDEDLLLLYNAAALFVFPSLEEGFGLPPLEAMACGTPVVASNASSMPEVLGDAALLVPPTDAGAIATAMSSVLTSQALSDALSEHGLRRSREFSWQRTAEQTLAGYAQAAGSIVL